MRDHPLARPRTTRLLEAFVRHHRPRQTARPTARLQEVAAAFSHIPYENLTKIIKEAGSGSREAARRGPAEVLADHFHWGTGGTCFSLTATLLHLVRAMGWDAEPILADRSYGPDTHCAVVVRIEGRPHLVDPGYLITNPVPLDSEGEQRVESPFNALVLRTRQGGRRLDLYTADRGRETYRLTFKADPVDAGEFYRCWDASFDWDMMRYPLLTRGVGIAQLYLRGNYFQVRTRAALERTEIAPEALVERIETSFGIHPWIAARALAVLRERGEFNGKPANR